MSASKVRRKLGRVEFLSNLPRIRSMIDAGYNLACIHDALVGEKLLTTSYVTFCIIVVGGTSSGKTTFVNAVIDAMTRLTASDRLVILEDATELQSSSPNTVSLQTSHMAGVDMRSLAKITMRLAPKRIIVGEVRDFAALEMLKVWDTGHPGGVSTFHADSAVESLHRLESLVEEAGLGPKRDLIGRAVDMVVYMTKTRQNTRIVDSIVRVNRYNPLEAAYETDCLYAA